MQPKTEAGGIYNISFVTGGQAPVTTTNCAIENSYHSAYLLQESYYTDTDANGNTIMVTDHAALCGLSEMDGMVTGNPKPQYVPVKLPWTYGQRFTTTALPGQTTAHCEEYEVVLVLIYLHLLHKFVVRLQHPIQH